MKKKNIKKLIVSRAAGELVRLGKNHMIDEQLQKLINETCERNEIRGADRELVQKGIEDAYVNSSLLELMRTGEMQVAGVKDGKLLWQVTEHGKAIAKKMLGHSDEPP